MEEITKLFESLPKPEAREDTLNFSAAQVEGTSHRIGKDPSGWPALLLSTFENQKGAQIRLEHLDVQHQVRCRITNGTSLEEGLYTVIRCTDADNELTHYFLQTINPLLKLLGPNPTVSEISKAITYLTELFRALIQPPIKPISGLWGELFVIRNAKDPIALMAAWHSSPEEKYDFSAATQRLEVKSTSQRQRVHHFSLEQLNPPAGCRAVVASLFIERNGGGTSLRELVEELQLRLVSKPDLQERLHRVVGMTLGNALRQGYASRFNRELAAESLKFFDVTTIPKIDNDLPASISDVHFKSDLSQSEVLTKEKLSNVGGIFSAI